jgi:hypothetical protein
MYFMHVCRDILHALLQGCTSCTSAGMYFMHVCRDVLDARLQGCTLCTSAGMYFMHVCRGVIYARLQGCTLCTSAGMYFMHVCRDVLYACLLQWQTPTFRITLFCRNMGPSSWLQTFPIKLVCTAIHEHPYLHLAVCFIQIINGQTETELDRLICFSSYQHMATPITNVTTTTSALIHKLRKMTSTFCWWGLPTLDHVQNAGDPTSTDKSKGDIRGFQQRRHIKRYQRSLIPHFTKICDTHLVHKCPNTRTQTSDHLITKTLQNPKGRPPDDVELP